MGVFAERVARRFELGPDELAWLESLEVRPVAVRRGQSIVEEGDPAKQAFVLLSGWVMSCTRFADGTHQVRRLHFAGDLLAMPSMAMLRHAEDLEAISDGVIAPFPKAQLAELFGMPRLAAIMYMLAQTERVSAGDRLACVGHNAAKACLAFLLVDILHRLRSTDPTVSNAFTMHLTREQAAQVIGTTPVHASRVWCALVAEGLIRCEGHTVTIIDEPRLIALAQYRAREGGFDQDWLRQVSQRQFAALAGR